MTSAKVTQAAGLLPVAAGMNAAHGTAGNADGLFSEIMDRARPDTGAKPELTRKGQETSAPAVKTERGGLRDTPQQADTVKEQPQEQAQTQTPQAEEVQEQPMEEGQDAKEVLDEAVGKVREALKETLGLSDEELSQLMSQLGLLPADLLDPGNMQAIVTAAAGETDMLSVLTNETLYQNVQELTAAVTDIVSEAKTELMADDTKFAELLAQMEEAAPQEEETQALSELVPQTQGPAEETEAQERPDLTLLQPQEAKDAQKEEEGTPQKAEDTADTQRDVQTLTEQTEAQAAQEESSKEQTPEERAEKKSSDTGGQTGKGAQGSAAHENAAHFTQILSRTGTGAGILSEALTEGASGPSYTERADAYRILDQIDAYMRLEAEPEMTEIDLHLQPETLGTLHIHLTAKEGVLTAQFTAENEAVRSALETQVFQLRENLNNQGFKVEAVEVTIASHAFDRSFAENGGDGAAYEEPKKRGPRRLQLDEGAALEDMELTDEERLAAEMMRQNGNTVDYMA